MTQEKKQLLLKDLSARVPYGVICACEQYNGQLKFVCPDGDYCVLQISPYAIETIKPYLRSMSTMTEKENKEYDKLFTIHSDGDTYCENWEWMDFMNSHHFDYRGLIPKGLALEAPEDMYKTK